MELLVTGALGYIGSHAVVELLAAGHGVLGIDNLCNSQRSVRARIERIAARDFAFVEADVRDRASLDALLRKRRIDAVLHFAGLKSVAQSVAAPLDYFDNNVGGTLALCESMARAGVTTLVFSSSATVYGEPATLPIREDAPLQVTNPYGRSKLMVEQVLRDLAASDPAWRIALLRYFNPVGAHESGLIGEAPDGIPNNLMPYVAQVAQGRRAALSVYGADYPTPDGTGLRDYIHVVDLAHGHVRALERLARAPGVFTCNLGTGRAYSVLEMVRAFAVASGRAIPYRVVARRPGDVAACYADPALAAAELSWTARRGLAQMCADAWRWQSGAAAKELQ
ncbi:MAG: UDP-glucose 4-epimerase GalE [Pseudomonadota bacterium]